MKARVEELKQSIADDKAYVAWKQQLMNIAKQNGDTEGVKYYRGVIDSCLRRILSSRRELAALKALLKD